MSSSKGNNTRNRPQKHQNKTAFKNNLHDTSTKTKFLNTLEVTGVCKRCKDIIDWKIKYKKYKMLSAPVKCVSCEQKNVKHAYHVMCKNCAKAKDVCAKCCKKIEVMPDSQNDQIKVNIPELLKSLPERKRRSILRYLNKHQEGDHNVTPETMSYIDDIIKKIDNVDLCSEETFDDSDDEHTDED